MIHRVRDVVWQTQITDCLVREDVEDMVILDSEGRPHGSSEDFEECYSKGHN